MAGESNTHANGVDQIVAESEQKSEASAKLACFNQSIDALSLVTIKSNTYSDRIDEIVPD
jgi:hypothetical protein